LAQPYIASTGSDSYPGFDENFGRHRALKTGTVNKLR
jgi:hypothetical protein